MMIFAIDQQGHREEIIDLYWFEENQVHDFDDKRYRFEVQLTSGDVILPAEPATDDHHSDYWKNFKKDDAP